MRKRTMKKKTIVIVVVVLAIAAAATVFITSAAAGEPAVKTAQVKRETLALTLTVSGKTEPNKKREVFAPVAGALKSVKVTEGQRVKKGQVLAVLDKAKLDAQVRTAQAQYDSADAQVAALSKRRTVQVPVAAAAPAGAPAGAPASAPKMKTTTLPEEPSMVAQREAARAQRRQAEIQLELAKDDRDQAVLRAPVAGIVMFEAIGAPAPDGSALKPVVGATVTPQAPLFTVVDRDSLKFVADVDEADVGRIAAGDTVTITLESFPGREFASEVKTVLPAAKKTTDGATVFPATMPLTGIKRGRIGMTGNALIEVDAVENALTIPAEALFEKDGRSFVYVLKGGKLAEKTVEVGAMTDDSIEIVKGLSQGQNVAIGGEGELKDGMKVKEGDR